MLDFGFYNMDCMEGMKQFPDKYFDLAVVDPPYGKANGEFNAKGGTRFGGRFDKYVERTGGTWAAKFGTKIVNWDTAPSQEYFDELNRVSKNQIIWGGIIFHYQQHAVFLFGEK